MINNALDNLSLYYPELQKEVEEMKLFYQEKLWHQLSDSLLKNLNNLAALPGTHLIDVYTGFVVDFATKIDQIKLMQFVMKVSDQYKDQEAIDFIKNLQTKILSDQQSMILAELKIGLHLLNLGEMEKVLAILKDSSKKIERISDVNQFLLSTLHKVFAGYHRKRKEFDELYKHDLQFLAYTPEELISKEEKIFISLEMAIAILVSTKIYNFSELLEQPVLKTLNQDPQYLWIYQLLETYNRGDVDLYSNQIKNFEPLINNFEVLKNNRQVLDQKIRIMSFLELVFSLPKNDRIVSFIKISEHAKINLDEVELLVMRVMSLELVKGKIDQIDQQVRISWIIPRVLDTTRLTIMRDKVEQWNKGINSILKQIETIMPNVEN